MNAIKYTCPRCSIHTCSLVCVKKHKKRAQCSGVRDPGAYRKRGELANPTSIDQDFNFITGVERSLQRAEDHVEERKIHLQPAGVSEQRGPEKLEAAAAERGIKLIRAPKGLSRRKQNTSHPSHHGQNIMWTVEWLHQKGWQRVSSMLDTQTIGEAFDSFFGKVTRKRKRGQDRRNRLRNEDETEAQRVPENQEESDVLADGHADGHEEGGKQPKDNPDKFHFYLHRPLTASNVKVLIPFPRETRLKDILKGQTIIEFPTIHIRLDSPDQISEPFMLEAAYIEQGEDVAVLPGHKPETVAIPELSVVHPNEVLEVMKQELKS